MKNKTLNLHLTDRCNFRCKHCFINMNNRELSLEDCIKAVDKIYSLNEYNRINLAGGEPLMVEYLQELIDYIVDKGFLCSIITNGSKLTEQFIRNNKGKLHMIGLSIDSMDDAINNKIGRKTIVNIEDLCKEIKNNNIVLKINICVTKHNLDYNFEPLLNQLNPDRLKLLQVYPAPHIEKLSDFIISPEEFDSFCKRLIAFNPQCEDNEHMESAYWIVDSEGYYGKDNFHSDCQTKTKIV